MANGNGSGLVIQSDLWASSSSSSSGSEETLLSDSDAEGHRAQSTQAASKRARVKYGQTREHQFDPDVASRIYSSNLSRKTRRTANALYGAIAASLSIIKYGGDPTLAYREAALVEVALDVKTSEPWSKLLKHIKIITGSRGNVADVLKELGAQRIFTILHIYLETVIQLAEDKEYRRQVPAPEAKACLSLLQRIRRDLELQVPADPALMEQVLLVQADIACRLAKYTLLRPEGNGKLNLDRVQVSGEARPLDLNTVLHIFGIPLDSVRSLSLCDTNIAVLPLFSQMRNLTYINTTGSPIREPLPFWITNSRPLKLVMDTRDLFLQASDALQDYGPGKSVINRVGSRSLITMTASLIKQVSAIVTVSGLEDLPTTVQDILDTSYICELCETFFTCRDRDWLWQKSLALWGPGGAPTRWHGHVVGKVPPVKLEGRICADCKARFALDSGLLDMR